MAQGVRLYFTKESVTYTEGAEAKVGYSDGLVTMSVG